MFSNLLNSAKEAVNTVAKSLEEQQHQNETRQGGTSTGDVVEETVGKIDSQGGKVQVNTVSDGEPKKQEASKDFLSGLVNIAQEVGKQITENSQKGAQAVKEGAGNVKDGVKTAGIETKNAAESGAKTVEEDLTKLGQNLGNLVSGLFNKDAKTAPEPAKEEFKPEPVIDDVEGEIAKVTTTATTVAKGPRS